MLYSNIILAFGVQKACLRFALKADPLGYIQARRACATHCRCRLCLPLFCRIYHTKSCIAARRLHLLRFGACLYFHHRNIRFRYSFHPLFWQRSFGFAYIPFEWIRCIHPFVHKDNFTFFACFFQIFSFLEKKYQAYI